MSVLSVVEKILEFADITGTSYTQHQDINIAYVIIHRSSKFSMAIFECNFIPGIQKTWVRFKKFFRTAHRELRVTTYITVQNSVMHHKNMVRNVVSGLQEVLQQEPGTAEVPAVVQNIQETQVNHDVNAVQYNQQQLM